jgi:hypothetical protein
MADGETAVMDEVAEPDIDTWTYTQLYSVHLR